MIKTSKINAIIFIIVCLLPFSFILTIVRNHNYYLYYLSLGPLLLFLIYMTIYNKFKSGFKLKRGIRTYYILLLLFIVIINYNYEKIGFSIYIIILYFIAFYFTIMNVQLDISGVKKKLNIIIIAYFVISLILTFFDNYYINLGGDIRFVGLASSSTVFGIISLMLYIIFIRFTDKKILLKFVLYVLLIYLLILVNSRINLAIGLFLPFYLYFINYKQIFVKYNKIIYIMTLMFFMAIYPLYQNIKFTYDINNTSRVTEDDSDRTRFYFSLTILKAISNADLINLFLGNGSNASVKLLGDESHKPHNDYLRIIYDYGLLFFLLFFLNLYYLYKKDKYLSYLVIIYFTSFYHNMIFDMYLFVLLLFMTSVSKDTNKRILFDQYNRY